MKKYVFLLVCFGLLMPGSGLVFNVSGQNVLKRKVGSAAGRPLTGKQALAEQMVRNYKSSRGSRQSAAAGDPCADETPIAVGQSLNGALEVSDCQFPDETLVDYYTFSGTAGQPVYISMNSSEVDTLVLLFDDKGELIDYNDDTVEGDTNSRLPANVGVVFLPYTGVYVIGASTFDPSVGAYTVSLATDPVCTSTGIAPNQTVNGALAGTDCAAGEAGEAYYTDIYKFSGTAGQQISIEMNSTTVDPYLTLFSPSGAGNVIDDDGGDATNARIPAESGFLTLTETGIYTIAASSAVAGQSGAYSLVLNVPNTTPTARAPYDFDGDGKTDVGIFRSAGGTGSAEWWYRRSLDSQSIALPFGAPTDRPVPADFTGDGKTDIAFFRPSTGEWFILRSEDNSFFAFPFGAMGDIPVVGDFDADGKADPGVFRPSQATWFVQKSTGGTLIQPFGAPDDKPVVADYDGDARADFAIYRPSGGTGSAEWWYIRSTDSQTIALPFGASTDRAVPADYTGDGRTDIAFWRPGSGEWFILRSEDNSFFAFPFGASGDIPVPGDYDGDGRIDPAVFRPAQATWFIQGSSSGTTITGFGAATDTPIPSVFLP